ncbi:MAG: hypothetical protein HY722_08535 [Planctomycetes bacterium]|nr:hypothetical protein [Planctomycetota bacterium]
MKRTNLLKTDRKSGQGLTEYLIIVVLVAIALITAVGAFGGKVEEIFTNSESALDTGVAQKIPGA